MGEYVAAARVESPALKDARETGRTWNWLVGIRCRVQISFAILERMPDRYPWERLPRYWRRCINASYSLIYHQNLVVWARTD
jgi:hypothetical protein